MTSPEPDSSDRVVRVVIADDQRLIRDSLAHCLGDQLDIAIVGLADDGPSALALVEQERPDVCIIDVRMPVLDGIEVAKRITASTTTEVVVLTTFDLDEMAYAARMAGAAGFLSKDTEMSSVIQLVRDVARGSRSHDNPVTTRRQTESSQPDRPTLAAQLGVDVTDLDILDAVAVGQTNEEIARAVFVSVGTVKARLRRLMKVLGCRNRVELAMMYRDRTAVARGGEPVEATGAASSDATERVGQDVTANGHSISPVR